MFANREAAGQALAEAVRELGPAVLKGPGGGPVVAALPRGGVPVALAVARALSAPLDLVLVRKVGLPWQPELAAAAVVNGDVPELVRNERVLADAGVDEATLEEGVGRALTEIDRRREEWFGDRPRPALAGRPVIVVDDGIATGSTALAALRALRRKGPSTLILAVPVGPTDTLRQLGAEADRVLCLQTPEPFFAVGQHYRDFRQVSDADVAAGLAEAAALADQEAPDKG